MCVHMTFILFPQAIAADCKRVTVLKYFLEALCGQEEPLLAFKGGKYISVATCPPSPHSDTRSRENSLTEKEVTVLSHYELFNTPQTTSWGKVVLLKVDSTAFRPHLCLFCRLMMSSSRQCRRSPHQERRILRRQETVRMT